MNIVFLSCDEIAGYVPDDTLLVKELESKGHTITPLSWTHETDWAQYDLVLIRSTWDYMKSVEAFFKKLQLISSQTTLCNSLDTVKWNIHKGYLSLLEKKGVFIIPTVFFKFDEELVIPSHWSEKVVIKPAISAGSYKTIVMNKNTIDRSITTEGDWMCQPFLPQIAEGEFSLIYFNKKFSHALKKVPVKGEFRVQEQFGGNVIPHTPSPELLETANKIMAAVEDDLLYARVDMVPIENKFALMELELIEPALYFSTSAAAVKNFSEALSHVKR